MEQRTIRFKAKRLDNGEWVEGDLNHSGDSVYVDMVKVDPSTICQFTGIYDKDGKEIWEGDIIQYTSVQDLSKGGVFSPPEYHIKINEREVIFSDGMFCTDLEDCSDNGIQLGWLGYNSLKELKTALNVQQNETTDINGMAIDESLLGVKVVGNEFDRKEEK